MIIYHCDRCLPFIPLPGITQPHDEAAEIGEFLDLDVALGEAERTSFLLVGTISWQNKRGERHQPDTPKCYLNEQKIVMTNIAKNNYCLILLR
jgi:hypothetical protein